MKRRLLTLCLTISLTHLSFASEDIYTFSSPTEQARFSELTSELRCLVCQNQNLAESNAPLANDLRTEIYHQILAGDSNEAIIQYLVKRYGSYVLYRPPLTRLTLGLWLGPFCVLMLGILLLVLSLRGGKTRKSA